MKLMMIILKLLDKFINLNDETLMSIKNEEFLIDKMTILFWLHYQKNFKNLKCNGGETGIRTQEELPLCRFSRPVLSTAQPSLLEKVL